MSIEEHQDQAKGTRWPRRTRRRARMALAVLPVALALGLSACGGDSSGDNASSGDAAAKGGDVPKIKVAVTSSEAPVAVAVDQKLFKGVDVEYQMVGFDAKTPLFLKNKDMPITELSPVEVAQEISKGEDIVYFSTATGLYFWNGILIRAKDEGTYKSIADLKGKKIGQPGFGTGTWAAFAGIAKSLYGLDARKDFKLVTADPGALLGLLAAGKIDAALTFAGQAATGLASPQFRMLASLGQLWEEKTGQPPLVDGLVARRDWLEKNPETAKKFAEGVDAGTQWMKDHPEEFDKGGQYEKLAQDGGWLTDDPTRKKIVELLQKDQWYAKSELYTQDWIDANYEFVKMALEGNGEKPPAKDLLFASPGEAR